MQILCFGIESFFTVLKFFLFQLTEVIGDKREREGTDDADVWQNMETVKDGNKNDKPKKKKKK